MRRALESIDPRTGQTVTAEEMANARDAVLQAFSALRETFLEELDLQEPEHPLLVPQARRLKQPGTTQNALLLATQQSRKQADGP